MEEVPLSVCHAAADFLHFEDVGVDKSFSCRQDLLGTLAQLCRKPSRGLNTLLTCIDCVEDRASEFGSTNDLDCVFDVVVAARTGIGDYEHHRTTTAGYRGLGGSASVWY